MAWTKAQGAPAAWRGIVAVTLGLILSLFARSDSFDHVKLSDADVMRRAAGLIDGLLSLNNAYREQMTNISSLDTGFDLEMDRLSHTLQMEYDRRFAAESRIIEE